jgi:Fe-S cluster biogenesis protein NfuA
MKKGSNILRERIETALDSIRPYLTADGGDVVIKEITSDNILIIEFQGNCVSCPMSNMTLKAGIEDAVLNSVPEIKKVVALNMPDETSSLVTN